MLEGVYADQLKLIKAAVAAREKRKKVGRVPDYLFMRERLHNVAPHSSFAALRHYRMPYNNGQMISSHCLPTLQSMFLNSYIIIEFACVFECLIKNCEWDASVET